MPQQMIPEGQIRSIWSIIETLGIIFCSFLRKLVELKILSVTYVPQASISQGSNY